jgi:hypothetical protein
MFVFSGPNRVFTATTNRTPSSAPTTPHRKQKREGSAVLGPGRPLSVMTRQCLRQSSTPVHIRLHSRDRGLLHPFQDEVLLRKEVIQPHLPVRLPCYDFVPIASPTFDGSLPQGVGPPASGVADFRDVTGGVYKARERIHRSVADLRLLATPTSRGRVADPDPN